MSAMRTVMLMFKPPTKEQAQSQKGNAIVEFALILPVFLTLLAGMISFSFALYNKTVLTMATREGARAGAITGDKTKAQDAADAFADDLIFFGTKVIPVFTPDINTSTKIVTVTADYTYNGLFWDFISYKDSSKYIVVSATTSMRLEE